MKYFLRHSPLFQEFKKGILSVTREIISDLLTLPLLPYSCLTYIDSSSFLMLKQMNYTLKQAYLKRVGKMHLSPLLA